MVSVLRCVGGEGVLRCVGGEGVLRCLLVSGFADMC